MKSIKACLAFVSFVLISQYIEAAPVNLSWVPPTTCTDGSAAATNCPTTGFEIECNKYKPLNGTEVACSTVITGNVKTVAANVTQLAYDVGTVPYSGAKYTFVARTVSNALKSANSAEASKDFPATTAPVPGKPTDLRIALFLKEERTYSGPRNTIVSSHLTVKQVPIEEA